jgi:hypothetical protein
MSWSPRQSISLTGLVTEARMLAKQTELTGQWYWKGTDSNLPPTLRGLGAQNAVIRTNPGPVRLEISMKSGFFHRGFIVICDPNAPTTKPKIGENWHVREIGESVYEYEE